MKVNPVYLQHAELRAEMEIEAQKRAQQARLNTKVGNPYVDFVSKTTEWSPHQ